MKQIPNARGVLQSLRGVRVAIRQALKGLNEAAGQLMAKGDYTAAAALAEKGLAIQQFQTEVEALRDRWRELCGIDNDALEKTGGRTPLWSYYQPILKALVSRGGEARVKEIEEEVATLLNGILQAGDHAVMKNGRERWQVMIRRARKPLVAEGWIDDDSGHAWRITESGRRAATRPLEKGSQADN